MSTSRTSVWRCVFSLWRIIYILAAWNSTAMGGDLDDKDFSLRLPASLSRFATYGDVAAVGGASAGSKWGSAINPASIAWLANTSNYDFYINPQYSTICFQEGTKLHVAALSGTVSTEEWGSWQPSFAYSHSNIEQTKTGLDFDYELNYYQLQWGNRWEDWAFGLNFNYAPSDTRFNFSSLNVSKTHSDSYGFRAGGLTRMTDKILAGVVLDYGFSRSRTVMYDFMGLGIGNIKINDTSHQYIIRPGLSYEYKQDSAIFVDYQYFHIYNDTGHLETHRFLAGIDHELIEGVFVRGGTTIDSDGNVALACGMGIYPWDWLTIDVGYQYDMFPELEPEFGRAQTLVASLGFSF